MVGAGAAVLLAGLAGSAAGLAGGPDAFGYAFRDSLSSGGPAFQFVDISLSGTTVPGFPCDDCVGTVPIGFPFQFYGGDTLSLYTQVNVSSNGFLTFSGGQPSGCCSGQALPSAAAPNNLVAGYWEDLNPAAGGTVKYRTVGTAPDRVFIVQFTSVPHFGGGNLTTFQFKLFEGTNNLEVHYKNVPSDGGTHGSGIENATGTAGMTYRFGSWSLANTAVRYAFLKPETQALLGGTPGDFGWWRSGVTVTLQCTPPEGASCESTKYRANAADPTPFSTYGAPFFLGADGEHKVEFYSTSTYGTIEGYEDGAVDPDLVTFRVDKTAPQVSLSASCSAPLVNGYCPGSVLVSATASDATSGLRPGQPACTLDGQPMSCAAEVTAPGAHVVKASAEDAAGNVASKSAPFTIDADPPALDLVLTCATPGDAGWCRGAAQVKVTATDAVSGVAPGSLACTLDGSPVPCGGFTAASDGDHDLVASAADAAGNPAVLAADVKVDATPPLADLGASCPAPGAGGWCLAPATLQATASDAASGVAFVECTVEDVPVDCAGALEDEGEHAAALLVRDAAGNEAQDALDVRVDTLAPAASVTTFCSKVGSPGWCRAASYAYEAKGADGGSGLASLACEVDGTPAACTGTVVGEGPHAVDAAAHDAAGHVGQAHRDLGIDSMPPSVGAVVSCTVPGSGGWCRGPALLDAAATDATSGVAGTSCLVDGLEVPCAAPYGLDGDHAFRAEARDVAGNTAADEVPLRVDATPPQVEALATCTLPGDAGWCRSDVVLEGLAGDATSGLASATCTLDGNPRSCAEGLVSTPGPHVFAVSAVDAAGNAASASIAFRIDAQIPEGTRSAPLLAPGFVQVAWTARDSVSGLALVEIQERSFFGLLGDTWAPVCTVPVSGATASGACTFDRGLDQVCYRILVRDVAGNVFQGWLHELLDLSTLRLTPSCGVSL